MLSRGVGIMPDAVDVPETMSLPASMGLFPWWLLLLQGVLALLLGIFLLTYPVQTLMVIITFLGAYWLVSGLFTLFGAFAHRNGRVGKILHGLLGILLGGLILAYPLYSTFLVPLAFTLMVGVLAVIYGIIALYTAFTGEGWGAGIPGVLSVIFGLLILAEPVTATVIAPFVFGTFGIIIGFAAIIGAVMARSAGRPGTTT